MKKGLLAIIVVLLVGCDASQEAQTVSARNQHTNVLIDRVEHHSVDNQGVNIHYVTLGMENEAAPLVLFVHGAPNTAAPPWTLAGTIAAISPEPWKTISWIF